MKNKRMVFILFGVILVLLVVSSYCIYLNNYRKEQVSLLNKEVELLLDKNMLNDEYNIELKTSGNYALVEEGIKSYYKELSDNIRVIYSYLNDSKLITILSASNINSDEPEFIESYNILAETRNNTNTAINNIIDLCSEEKIKSYVKKKDVGKYYYDLYLSIMLNEDDLDMLSSTKGEMMELNDNFITFLDKVEAIFNMLKNNSDYWYIENNQLYFEKNELVSEYNNLYNDLNNFVKEKFSKYSSN